MTEVLNCLTVELHTSAMAESTVDDVKPQDKYPVDSDSEDDDDKAEGQLLYITKPSQICHDRVLPKDLNTTQKSATRSRQGGPVAAGGMLRASAERRKLWHKKTLNVCFVEWSRYEDIIFEWAQIWSEHCGIQFKKVPSRFGSDIRIGFREEDGAWSYVGTDCADIPLNELTMNLGFIDRATVLHEFGHAIGLIHEHQSPSEGGFEWNRSKVIENSKGPPNYWDLRTIKSNIFYRYKKSQVSGTKYDRKSIMHYGYGESLLNAMVKNTCNFAAFLLRGSREKSKVSHTTTSCPSWIRSWSGGFTAHQDHPQRLS